MCRLEHDTSKCVRTTAKPECDHWSLQQQMGKEEKGLKKEEEEEKEGKEEEEEKEREVVITRRNLNTVQVFGHPLFLGLDHCLFMEQASGH